VTTFGVNFDLWLTQELSGSFNSESVAIPQGNACKFNFFTSHALPIYEKDSFRREDAKISSKLVSLPNDFIIEQNFGRSFKCPLYVSGIGGDSIVTQKIKKCSNGPNMGD
jgi:hypothetical protein